MAEIFYTSVETAIRNMWASQKHQKKSKEIILCLKKIKSIFRRYCGNINIFIYLYFAVLLLTYIKH